MQVHFYLMCYRTEALVASHLDAEQFGTYMAVGTQKHTFGNVMFFEVDPTFPTEWFDFDTARQRCQPHPDGSPKRSKYVSVYRVLEHVPVAALGRLHLVTRDGRVLTLESAPYNADHEEPGPNMYVELCPAIPRVASSLAPAKFCKFMTDPANPVCYPRLLFADNLLDREPDGKLAGYLPYRDPQHILDCLADLERLEDKMTKTVDRNPPLTAFFRTIRRGFFVGDQNELKFYPYMSVDEMEEKHHLWWRSASMG